MTSTLTPTPTTTPARISDYHDASSDIHNNGQADYGDATNGTNTTNGNAMQFGARLGTTIPNPFINDASYDDASCDDASCDDASYDDASYDDASCDDAS